ncbi:MAG TPA: hypothetical protein VJN94_13175, partial [Candidatus Binataceae bacterium]|nr:hypothetical protein [Candidatus Binataceae bacterium]
MRLFKATAIALVAGVGLAFVGAQAFAQATSSSGTSTTSSAGNTVTDTFDGGFSTTNLTATHTEGGAIAAAISVDDFTASGGASFPGFQGASFSEHESELSQESSSGGGQSSSSGTGLFGGGMSSSSGGHSEAELHASSENSSACFFCLDNGETSTLALANSTAWVSVSHSESQGSTSTSSTSSTGPSLAALFVF